MKKHLLSIYYKLLILVVFVITIPWIIISLFIAFILWIFTNNTFGNSMDILVHSTLSYPFDKLEKLK